MGVIGQEEIDLNGPGPGAAQSSVTLPVCKHQEYEETHPGKDLLGPSNTQKQNPTQGR